MRIKLFGFLSLPVIISFVESLAVCIATVLQIPIIVKQRRVILWVATVEMVNNLYAVMLTAFSAVYTRTL